MKLNELDNKLKEIGYLCFHQKNMGILFCSVDNGLGEPKLDTTIKIQIKSEKFLCSHYDRHIELEQEFVTSEELITFIKKNFG